MQLRTARLCLDCEELHENAQCPVCASEAFAYLARWVPMDERRARRRPAPAKIVDSSPVARWAKRGAIGLAVLGVSRLLWESTKPAAEGAHPPGSGPDGHPGNGPTDAD
jgi:hypothetical protein